MVAVVSGNSRIQNIEKIVKAIEGSVDTLREQAVDTAEKAEVQRREWEEQRARWESK